MINQKTLNHFDSVMRWAFYVLIFFLPVSTAMVEICSTVILTAFFFKRGLIFYQNLKVLPGSRSRASLNKWIKVFGESFKPPSDLRLPVGIFLIVNFLSVILSQYPMESLEGFMGKWFQAAFLFFSFVECFRARKLLKIFLAIYLVSAGVVCLDGWIQFFVGRGLTHQLLPDKRINSTFYHPNDLGGYLILVLPLLLSLILFWRTRKTHTDKGSYLLGSPHPWFILLFIGSLTCLGLTFSRGAWLGFFAALCFLSIKGPRAFVFLLLLSVAFVNIFFQDLVNVRDVSFTSDEVRIYENIGDKTVPRGEPFDMKKMPPLNQRISTAVQGFSGMGRRENWQKALSMISLSPVIGMGVNTYAHVSPQFMVKLGVYPHNCYLQMAVETGLAGLLSFLAILWVLFRNTLKSLRGIHDPYLHAAAMGLSAGLFGFLAHSFFDTNFYSVKLGNLMWIVMAVLVSVRATSASLVDKKNDLGIMGKI